MPPDPTDTGCRASRCSKGLCGTCSSSCCCDELCAEHGDCCLNFEDACPAEASSTRTVVAPEDEGPAAAESCEGRCGSCLEECCCESDCEVFGDCCGDYAEHCEDR